MSYFDDELTAELKALNISFDVLSQTEHASMVVKINEAVRFSGSQIPWNNLKNSVNFGWAPSKKAIAQLAEEIEKLADKDLIFLGDSACDEAYSIGVEYLEKTLRVFSELPQHTYIMPKSLNWIACISFAGYLDFAILCPD
jgi:hypothetical protein